jgi:hypothetical protein
MATEGLKIFTSMRDTTSDSSDLLDGSLKAWWRPFITLVYVRHWSVMSYDIVTLQLASRSVLGHYKPFMNPADYRASTRSMDRARFEKYM